jgi:hypothetical protein
MQAKLLHTMGDAWLVRSELVALQDVLGAFPEVTVVSHSCSRH